MNRGVHERCVCEREREVRRGVTNVYMVELEGICSIQYMVGPVAQWHGTSYRKMSKRRLQL